MAECGPLRIKPPFHPSLVEVTGCANFPGGNVFPGDSFTVAVTVDNPNELPAIADVSVSTNGKTLGNVTDVDIPAVGTREVNVTATAPDVGAHPVTAEVDSAEEGSATGVTRLNTCASCR